MNEQLKPIYIDGEATNYSISSNGRAYNNKLNKWLQGRISINGYVDIKLIHNGKQKMFRAHRLVAKAFLPNPDNLPVVNHKDGNKQNNNVENLEWVSQQDNVIHAYNEGLITSRPSYEMYNNQDLDGEIWLRFKDSQYLISNMGRVRNEKTNKVLKGKRDTGYVRVELSLGEKRKNFLVHRLVYSVFNNDTLEDSEYVINHIDGDKQNNKLDNLEKVTKSENIRHSLYVTKTNKTLRPVIQYDKDMNFIKEHISATSAAKEVGSTQALITAACQRCGTSRGFNWRYKE